MEHIAPEFLKDGFSCPHCGAYAKQDWRREFISDKEGIYQARCQLCNKISVWYGEDVAMIHSFGSSSRGLKSAIMIFPKATGAPFPNEDLHEDIKADYVEAANILQDSPRGACALLRLALQKLMVQLGESGHINKDIGNLVKKGLNPTIQQALDIVRVVGNEAVHPGELDLKDNVQIATQMFGLINLIANERITHPKKVRELYGKIPDGAVESIEKRDGI